MSKVKYRPLYPVGTSPVRSDKNLYLLNVDYNIAKDELMILYKRYDNGEKILDIIQRPQVPVFVYTKGEIKDKVEYLSYDDCICHLVSYKDRDTEIQNILIGVREIMYKDSYGNTVYKKLKNKSLPMLGRDSDRSELSAVQFSPKLALSDKAITDLIMWEYANTRYHAHDEISVLPGVPYYVDDITIPDLHIAAWDIETHIVDDKNDPKYERINAISYVDDKHRECKLVYLLDEEYKNQAKLTDKEKFVSETVSMFKDVVNSIDSGDAKADNKIKTICIEFIDSLNWVIDAYDDELGMLDNMFDHMYNVRKPDILAAFNTGYDLSKSEARFKKLRGNSKMMNAKEYDEEPAYWWGGDSYHPIDRRVNLNNKSLVVNDDFQSTHYRNRTSEEHTTHSLEYTSTKTIKFGKWDFSDICNSITKLPFLDFYRFMQYSALDSILIILNNYITNDLKIKHIISHIVKTGFAQYHQNMSKIPSAIDSVAYRYGVLATPNTNKLIKYLNVKDMPGVEETLGIKNLAAIKREITSGKSISGGLVADPNLFEGHTPYTDFNGEVNLMHNMLQAYVNYIDASSLYPTEYITNNLSKTTLIGVLTSIYKPLTEKPKSKSDLELVLTTDENEAKGTGIKPYKDLGLVNSAVIMDNVLKIGEVLFGLPSSESILEKKFGIKDETFVDAGDDESETQSAFTIEIPKVLPRLSQIFSGMNKIKLSEIDATSLNKDDDDSDDEDNHDYNEVASVKLPYLQKKSTKYFPICKDSFTFKYYGTHIHQKVNKGCMYDLFKIPEQYRDSVLYGHISKNMLIVDNSMITQNRLDPDFNNITEAYEGVISTDDLVRIASDGIYTTNLNLNGYSFYTTERAIYYPFTIAIKQSLKSTPADKYYITPLSYKLFVRDKTALLQLTYSVKDYADTIDIEITQSMNIIVVKYEDSPLK